MGAWKYQIYFFIELTILQATLSSLYDTPVLTLGTFVSFQKYNRFKLK